ncbi:MAG: hypothetical protein WA005_04545 [Candidatus Binataceae bacterium]
MIFARTAASIGAVIGLSILQHVAIESGKFVMYLRLPSGDIGIMFG